MPVYYRHEQSFSYMSPHSTIPNSCQLTKLYPSLSMVVLLIKCWVDVDLTIITCYLGNATAERACVVTGYNHIWHVLGRLQVCAGVHCVGVYGSGFHDVTTSPRLL